MLLTDEAREYVFLRYNGKTTLDVVMQQYERLPEFKINENIFDTLENSKDSDESSLEFNSDLHMVMRLVSQYYMRKVFQAMRVDLGDPNVEEDLSVGNISTPGRVIKMWTGGNIHDDRELLSGRWSKKPRIASFPNTVKAKIPITKRIDLTAVCSHHLAPFSSTFREDAYAIVSYIPDEKVLGISKLQRVVNWISQRGWLQEDLTKTIYDEISKVAETESVYVALHNIVHTCESLRGAKSSDGAFTSEYYGGAFEDPETRKQVQRA